VTVVMLILFAIGGLVDRIVERRQARRKGAKA
jgi:hypothetical protein